MLSDLGKLFCVIIWHCYNLFIVGVVGRCCSRQHVIKHIGDFPIWVAVVITIGWMLFCSWLFTFWEDWDMLTSTYFFFQSLTTIGFGELQVKLFQKYICQTYQAISHRNNRVTWFSRSFSSLSVSRWCQCVGIWYKFSYAMLLIH